MMINCCNSFCYRQSNNRRALLLLAIFLLGAFQSTGTARAQDPPEANLMYNTAATLFGENQFELAIEQWQKLLDKYPDFRLRRDTRYFMALAHYNLKQFDESADGFASLRDSLPNLKDYRRSEKTLIYLAYSQYQQGKAAEQGSEKAIKSLKQSTSTYDQFFENFRDSEMVAEIRFYHGEALYEWNRQDPTADTLGAATASYKKILDDHPDAEIHQKAMFAYAGCLEESGDYPQARTSYQSYLDAYPTDPKADEVRMRMAESTLQLGIARQNSGDAEQAASLYQTAANDFAKLAENPEFASRAMATNQLARCLLRLGKVAEAADKFAIVANDFPDFEFARMATIDAGKYYYTSGKLDVAKKWLDKVIENDSENRAEASHWLCQIHNQEKQYEKTLDLTQTALAQAPGRWEVNLLMDRADALYETPTQRAEGIAAYEKIAADHASHKIAPRALYYASFGQMQAEKFDESIKLATLFSQQFKNDELLPDTLEVLARSALSSDALKLANDTYSDLIARFDRHPRHQWWQTRVGWIAFLQDDYDQAIALLATSLRDIQDKVSISEANYIIGASQFELKSFAKSIEAIERSLKANPERPNANQARLLAARAHSRLSEFDKAMELANEVATNAKESEIVSEAAYWLGEFAYKSNDFPTAIENYEKVVADPNSNRTPDALYGLGWAKSSTGKPAEALVSFDRLIKDFPKHELAKEALIGRGKVRRIAGEFDNAIGDLNQFLDSQPDADDRQNALFERALCHVGKSDWAAAIKDLDIAKNESPPTAEIADDVLFELAWAYSENGNEDEAANHFGQIVEDYPESPHAGEANYHVGQKHYAAKNYDDAIQFYETAIAKSDDEKVNELSVYKIGWCHFMNSDYPNSLKAFKSQTDKHPNGDLHALGLSMVAESHFQMKQHAQAVTAYKVALPAIESAGVTSKVRILAPIHAAQSANEVKDYKAALEYAQKVVDDHPDTQYATDALYEMGVAQKGLGNSDEAVKAWTRAMEGAFGKTSARARCMIGEELFLKQDYQDAVNQFKLVIYGSYTDPEGVKPWKAFAAYEAARCHYVQISSETDAARKQQLIKDARDMFQLLVDRFPNDDLAADARKQIKVLDSLK